MSELGVDVPEDVSKKGISFILLSYAHLACTKDCDKDHKELLIKNFLENFHQKLLIFLSYLLGIILHRELCVYRYTVFQMKGLASRQGCDSSQTIKLKMPGLTTFTVFKPGRVR